jgi:hypothetical protein
VIAQTLVERYYRDGSPDPQASSHWRRYSSEFSVETDGAGNVVKLSGVGFGIVERGEFHESLFNSACVASHLAWLRPRRRILASWRTTQAVCRAMGIDATFDAFRQACTFELLDRFLPGRARDGVRALVIGDGHGTLSALLKTQWPAAQVTLVDLGRTLLFQVVRCQRAFPTLRHELATAPGMADGDFVYCPADELQALETSSFDIAINVASMQEMTPAVVDNYFSFLRRRLVKTNLFYCCNRERKVLPDGEVSAFRAYPWQADDRLLLDGRCPWHQYFLSHALPFVHWYDGIHLHRLAVMATESP